MQGDKWSAHTHAYTLPYKRKQRLFFNDRIYQTAEKRTKRAGGNRSANGRRGGGGGGGEGGGWSWVGKKERESESEKNGSYVF